jgi:hypothetical protein
MADSQFAIDELETMTVTNQLRFCPHGGSATLRKSATTGQAHGPPTNFRHIGLSAGQAYNGSDPLIARRRRA